MLSGFEIYPRWVPLCESSRNFKGFSITFSNILDAIYRFMNVRIFLIPISITFLNPKILGFFFLRKTALLGE